MDKRFIRLILILALAPFLFSAVKQVRVAVDRAVIYAEPNKNSSRIDIVIKGTVLNLFQQKRVKDVWYYVSYNSPRYGNRISGFIHESAVTIVGQEGAVRKETVEVRAPEQTQPPPEKPASLAEKPAPPSPKIEEKKEIKRETLPPPKIEEKKEIQEQPITEALALTPLPRVKPINLPKKVKAWQDIAWRVISPKKAEKKEPAEKVLAEARTEPKPIKPPPPQPPPPPVPEVKKAQPEVKKEEPKAVTTEPKKVEKEKPQVVQPVPPQPARIVEPRRERRLLTFGLGCGSSFGGAGGLVQLNTKAGISLHGGLGMYPTKLIYSDTDWVENEVLYSVGVKYYLPFNTRSFAPYIDLQYGGLGVEAAQVVVGIWEYSYILSYEQKALWGPSFLGGAEIRFGRFGLNGAVGISYNLTDWQYLDQNLFFTFDAGLVIYF